MNNNNPSTQRKRSKKRKSRSSKSSSSPHRNKSSRRNGDRPHRSKKSKSKKRKKKSSKKFGPRKAPNAFGVKHPQNNDNNAKKDLPIITEEDLEDGSFSDSYIPTRFDASGFFSYHTWYVLNVSMCPSI